MKFVFVVLALVLGSGLAYATDKKVISRKPNQTFPCSEDAASIVANSLYAFRNNKLGQQQKLTGEKDFGGGHSQWYVAFVDEKFEFEISYENSACSYVPGSFKLAK
jgi:hypothetical protein